MKNIDVSNLKELLTDKSPYILDVRTYEEFAIASIGGVNIPLDELGDRIDEIPQDQEIFCLCHHGVRSQYACQLLKSFGIENVTNIAGGIDQWSLKVDNLTPRY